MVLSLGSIIHVHTTVDVSDTGIAFSCLVG